MKKLLLLGCFISLVSLAGAFSLENPFLAENDSTPGIEANKFTMKEPMAYGRNFLTADFNSLDAAGSSERTGKWGTRKKRVTPECLKLIPAPNANNCMSCHYLPYAGKSVTGRNG